jgi:hypothetical protein
MDNDVADKADKADVESIFSNMVDEFKANKNKQTLIQIMTEYCRKKTTTPKQIYKLKRKLEVDFSNSVKCKYCYYTITPVDYGCDLREIFYDRNNDVENAKIGYQKIISLGDSIKKLEKNKGIEII